MTEGVKSKNQRPLSSAKEFIERFTSQLDPKKHFIVLPGPVKRAVDLKGPLTKMGFECLTLDLYKTITCMKKKEGEPLYGALERGESLVGVVCFFSPSAVEGFWQFFKAYHNQIDCLACCLGETTGKKARQYFSKVVISPKAEVQSLINLAQGYL